MEFNVHIQELGKIEKLNLEIKPLTVIAGENSSGKTFATKSIYCVLEALNQNHLTGAFQEQADTFIRLLNLYETSLIPKTSKADEEILAHINESFISIANDVTRYLSGLSLSEHSRLENILTEQKEQLLLLNDSIQRYLSRFNSVEKTNKSQHFLHDAAATLVQINETLSDGKKSIRDYIAKALSDNFKANYQVTRLSDLVNSNKKNEAKIQIEHIGELLFNHKNEISFKFEAQAINQIQKIEHVVFIDSPIYLRIREGLQKSQTRYLSHNRELKGYPEYIDNLYSYVDRKYMDPPEEDFSKLSTELQETISGKLMVNKAGEIHYHDEAGEATPLSLAATGVNNLGLIDLLIRNSVIKAGSFLIIDEPEAHIHPKWQVLLMEILYKMAQAGVNVIIATHSLDMLKKLQLIVKQDPAEANKIVSVHRMPQSNLDKHASLLDKIEESLTDLSTPFYEMYLEENS